VKKERWNERGATGRSIKKGKGVKKSEKKRGGATVGKEVRLKTASKSLKKRQQKKRWNR